MKKLLADFCVHIYKRKYYRFLAGVIPLLLTTQTIYADTPLCSAIYQNAVQTHHGEGNYINFGFNARITNASSNQLRSPNVRTRYWSPIKSCGDEHCTWGAPTVPQMFVNNFLNTGSQVQINVPAKKSMVVGEGIGEIGLLNISEYATATFSPTANMYVIDRLFIGYKSKLRLPEGQYWIRDFRMEVESRIDVIGEGTVNIFVQNSLDVPFNAKINENTKDPARLAIYDESSSHFHVGSKTYGFVVTENELILSHGAKIYGGLVGKYIELESESEVVFNPAAARTIDIAGLCRITMAEVDTVPPQITLSPLNFSGYYEVELKGIIEDIGSNASGVASAVLSSPEPYPYEEPIYFSGNSFRLDLFPNWFENVFTITATDVAGNVSSETISFLYPPKSQFVNVYPTDSMVFNDPDIIVTGEIDTYWPLESIGAFTMDGVLYNLEPLDMHGLRLTAPKTLLPGRNEIVLSIRDHNYGDIEHRIVVYYEPE